MVPLLPVAFSALLLIVGSARAQVSAPSCSDTAYSWTANSLGQGPCLVMAYLAAVCNNGVFVIPSLLPQHSYLGPTGLDDGDLCKCNTVAYNLISACDACQGESWLSYSSWNSNCTTVGDPGVFPEPVPVGTRVPKWAYLDPTTTDNWNASAARLAGDSPEITGSSSIVPSTTKGSQSTITPKTSASAASSSNSSSKSSSNTGAIAGGVVGGIIGAALIAGVVAWFTIRRRRARSAPSAAYMSGQGGDVGIVAPFPLTVETPRLYDPSDPSTYPQATSPTIHTTNYSNPFPSSESDLQPYGNRQAYSGLPEV